MRLATKFLMIIFLALTISSYTKKENFIGEIELENCLINIPLSFSSKNRKELIDAVDKFKDVEIVLLSYSKKKSLTYSYYYIVRYEGSYGESAYLVKSAFFNSAESKHAAFFLNYNPKKHMFYDANCFKEKLNNDSTLNDNFIEIK